MDVSLRLFWMRGKLSVAPLGNEQGMLTRTISVNRKHSGLDNSE